MKSERAERHKMGQVNAKRAARHQKSRMIAKRVRMAVERED
jgi:hypothetical protein